MRTDHGTSIRVVLCMATAALFLAFFSSKQALGGEAQVRPVASMTLDERMNLPDNTMVKLKSGRTASLGTLRVEHRARLERFSRAAGLGQMTASKLAVHPASSTQLSPVAPTKVQSSTGAATKSGGANRSAVTQSPGPQNKMALMNSGLVPFQISNPDGIPKDYADFCKAANASVCVYLPASTTLTAFQGDPTTKTSWAYDEDAFITDMSVCKYDGGSQFGGGCLFYYPVIHVTNFKPTGPLTTAASCDPPGKYYVDPKGAVKASYDYPSPTFTTVGAPITCVVQVWVSK
jgi:hypothetical protein